MEASCPYRVTGVGAMEDGDGGLATLSRTQCQRLLGGVTVGRRVFTEHAPLDVRPVNFVLIGRDIVVKTGPRLKFAAAHRGDVVAFDVDRVETSSRMGWSVLVVGRAWVITDIDELVAVADPRRRPRVRAGDERFIRIAGERISGRRVRLSTGSTPTEAGCDLGSGRGGGSGDRG